MEPIYPLTAQRIRPFCGQIVCAVTKDGLRHVGVLSRCKDGQIMLNSQLSSPKTVKCSIKKKNRRASAATKAAPAVGAHPFNYSGGYFEGYPVNGTPTALPLSRIAYLFLVL